MLVHKAIVGHESSSVLTIGDALHDPTAARVAAQFAQYGVDSQYYPGIRAPLPAPLQREMLGLATRALQEAYGFAGSLAWDSGHFALVCQPAADLSLMQRLPHYDGCSDQLYACVLYLATQDWGGTAFFRHRSTGFESISPGREQDYLARLQGDLASFGPPPQDSFAAPSQIYETTESFVAAYNRMLLYRGNMLHSGIIDSANVPPPSPDTGRLTITCFFRASA
jgi:hypothetical protein